MSDLLAKLYQSSKTIVTSKDLALLWQEVNRAHLHAKISYYIKQKHLIRLARGVYAKNSSYNPKELATSIYVPSYISFETVLREAGIIFQHHETIYVAATWSKNIIIDQHQFCFRKLKPVVLYNPSGIINRDNYSIATPERAFLDMLYLFPNYYFDNLAPIDWEKCLQIVAIYENKQLNKRLKKIHKDYVKQK